MIYKNIMQGCYASFKAGSHNDIKSCISLRYINVLYCKHNKPVQNCQKQYNDDRI